MAVEFRVPDIGESVSEVELGEWFVSPGDTVQVDDPLVVIETEMITMEITSPTSGVLHEILMQTGEVAEVGAVLALIEETGVTVAPRKEAVAATAQPSQPSWPEPPPGMITDRDQVDQTLVTRSRAVEPVLPTSFIEPESPDGGDQPTAPAVFAEPEVPETFDEPIMLEPWGEIETPEALFRSAMTNDTRCP